MYIKTDHIADVLKKLEVALAYCEGQSDVSCCLEWPKTTLISITELLYHYINVY